MGLCESADECRLSDDQSKSLSFFKKNKEDGCRRLFSSTTVEPMPQIYKKSATTPGNAVHPDPVLGINLALTATQTRNMARFWRETIASHERDIFHRTMLFCIEASPKLNEIIACGHYCFRDLTKWPKLNKICQEQFLFFERIVVKWECDEERVREVSLQLGVKHAQYATHGLKPHFFDIYQQQFIGFIQASSRDVPPTDRKSIVDGFTKLTSFIVDLMNVGQTLRTPS